MPEEACRKNLPVPPIVLRGGSEGKALAASTDVEEAEAKGYAGNKGGWGQRVDFTYNQ